MLVQPSVVAAQHGEHAREQPEAERADARPVDRRRVGVARLLDVAQREHQRRRPSTKLVANTARQPNRVDEQPADQRPGGEREPDRRAPGADRAPPLGALEGLGEDRQRAREHDRRAEPLEEPRGDQRARARRERAQQRGRGEHRQPDQEQPPAAEAVGEAAGGEQEHRERERVAAEHPLQVGEARAERLGDRRLRDLRRGHVEQQQRRRDADDAKGPALACGSSVTAAEPSRARDGYPWRRGGEDPPGDRGARARLRAYVDAYAENDLLTYASAISFQILSSLVPFLLFALRAARLPAPRGRLGRRPRAAGQAGVSPAAFAFADEAVRKALGDAPGVLDHGRLR